MRGKSMIYEKGCRLYLGKSYHNLLGAFNTDGVFIVHVKKPDHHFYVKGQGYPLNKELLEYLQQKKIDTILLPERSKRFGFRVFKTTVKDYLTGELILEDGFEPQMVIPLVCLVEQPEFRKYEMKMMRLLYRR